MSFTGFEQHNVTFGYDAPPPRDISDILYQANHAEGHFVKRNTPLPDEPMHPHEAEDEHHALREDIESVLKTAANLSPLVEGTRKVEESIAMHKYSRLANASYDYFNSKGNAGKVHDGLRKSRYGYIEDLKGFEVDEELSTLDNLVLHNPITGETHISFRGTTDDIKRTREFLSDWKTNSKIAFNPRSAENTKRIAEARAQTERVIEKYGKDELTVSGHSAGGFCSSTVSEEFDIAGHHFNPAISARQVRNTVATRTEQNIYKTELDFASPLAFSKRIRGNYNVNLVSITEEVPNQAIVGAHSIEQFAPEIESVASTGLVTVERNTMLSSVKKSAGSIIALGITAYDTAKEMKEDRKTGDELQKAAKQTITAAEQTEEFVADNAIMDVGLALAPETYGLSIVAALGATVIHNMAVSHFAAELKHEASTGIARVESWFKKLF